MCAALSLQPAEMKDRTTPHGCLHLYVNHKHQNKCTTSTGKKTNQVVVVGVEPLAQLQPALLRRVWAAAGHGEVAREGAAGEVVEAVYLGGWAMCVRWWALYMHTCTFIRMMDEVARTR